MKLERVIKTGLDEGTVTERLDIDTTGQFVVKGEREYWRKQMDDIEHAVLEGNGH